MEALPVPDNSESKALPSMPSLFPLSQPSSPAKSFDEEMIEVEPEPAVCEDVNQSESKKDDILQCAGIEPVKTEETNDVAFNSMPKCDELVIRADASPSSDKRKPTSIGHHPPPRKRRKLETFDVPEAAEEEPDNHYAEAYFSKVKSALDEATFQRFIAILSNVSDEPGCVISLYRELESLLANFPELVDDFVGLLTPHQALSIGKLQEYKLITRSLAFFKKLEGNHLTRLIHALEQLNSNPSVTPEQVKSAVLPLLKGHGPLADHFLHLLPNEKPPPSSPDDFENITEPMMLEDGDDGGWDHVRIPEHAERGCLSDCGCRCHAAPTHPFCLACNIRFIKGQAYVQYGKVIRYCKVHFGNMSHDEVLQRFNPALYSKIKRKKKSIIKTPHSEPSKALPEFVFQDENALLSKDDVSSKLHTELFSSPKIEEKNEDEDDYWEEDDVSSGDKSSAGDVFEEADRHSEDTDDNTKFLERLAHPLSPLGSTVEGYYLEGEFGEESRGAAEEGVRKGIVIDVSDVRPNGVNAHVIKFETRPSNGPCVNSTASRADSNPNSHGHVIRDATVVFDYGQSEQFDPVFIDNDDTARLEPNDNGSLKEKFDNDVKNFPFGCPDISTEKEKMGDSRSDVPKNCDKDGDSVPTNVDAERASNIAEEKPEIVKVELENDSQNDDIDEPPISNEIQSEDANVAKSDDESHVKIESNPIDSSDGSPCQQSVPEDIIRTVKLVDTEITSKTDEGSDAANDDPTNSNVDSSATATSNVDSSATSEVQEWTMQEDKLILESFLRKNGVDDLTIAAKIRESMPRWTVHEIQERFKVLWDLLMKTMN
ncbi:Gon-4-like (Hypothetical protein) [Nesidiocoris tenuis]|uniref:Myb-like domain-containing protein n=1 Tax=Nesidiocoris tenuis TaxID=355587 RepID=A0ABN7B7U6_9HEMI|nr:Gon-4-like (Hypothetical protein) [Nesidiocoris tenuis]